ncbi:hypothetical protein NA57DRAFT_59726 [Rhizodiscina lignyota]|uniref:Uncharacterized protein n=1 Tax=Rhizodiscina lignyota TaxID=1504668 RepID=A0A9P4ICJ7_9PEZI|nr:hypothetical protein NA57DRAFT_59726 [Rhizodiscina lignyota]
MRSLPSEIKDDHTTPVRIDTPPNNSSSLLTLNASQTSSDQTDDETGDGLAQQQEMTQLQEDRICRSLNFLSQTSSLARRIPADDFLLDVREVMTYGTGAMEARSRIVKLLLQLLSTPRHGRLVFELLWCLKIAPGMWDTALDQVMIDCGQRIWVTDGDKWDPLRYIEELKRIAERQHPRAVVQWRRFGEQSAAHMFVSNEIGPPTLFASVCSVPKDYMLKYQLKRCFIFLLQYRRAIVLRVARETLLSQTRLPNELIDLVLEDVLGTREVQKHPGMSMDSEKEDALWEAFLEIKFERDWAATIDNLEGTLNQPLRPHKYFVR